MTPQERDPRILVVVAGSPPDSEDLRAIADREAPDVFTDDELGAISVTEADLESVPGFRGRVLRRMPGPVGLAVLVHLRRHEHDVVLTWSEQSAWPIALVLSLVPRRRLRHIAILMWPFEESSSSSMKRMLKRRLLPWLARHGIDRFCIPAPLQRRTAIKRWKLSDSAIVPLEWATDMAFWSPRAAVQDTICAVGREMRDYATLLEALDGTDIPCHIAAGTAALNRAYGTEDERAGNIGTGPASEFVTVGPLSFSQLRDLYARSSFVVIPLLPTSSDNGISAVMEAMGMGRAVIASETEGRSDLLRHGENCLLVPPQDAGALRAAILRLWNDPEECARLGAVGRDDVVVAHGMDRWVATVAATARELVAPA